MWAVFETSWLVMLVHSVALRATECTRRKGRAFSELRARKSACAALKSSAGLEAGTVPSWGHELVRAATEWDRRGMRVQIEPGVRLFVDVDGCSHRPDGDRLKKYPTLVLLHGGPGHDHSAFKPDLLPLAEDMQVVFVDHRGMGRSDRRDPSEWNLDQWADDVIRVCDALGIEKPFVLGASFGAMVAMRYLARHPTHAAKVVLVCGTARVVVEEQLAVLDKRGVRREVREAAEAFWRNPTPENGAAFLPLSESIYAVAAPLPPSRSVSNYDVMFHFMLGEMQTMDLLPGLAGTTTPTLVLGGIEDPVTPASGMVAIADAIGPNATLELIAHASHFVWADRPDCIDLIRNWLLLPQ